MELYLSWRRFWFCRFSVSHCWGSNPAQHHVCKHEAASVVTHYLLPETPTSLKERLGLLWWLELLVVRACFPHWVPVFTILFSLMLASSGLPIGWCGDMALFQTWKQGIRDGCYCYVRHGQVVAWMVYLASGCTLSSYMLPENNAFWLF